jgi:hypothetical protein
MKVVKFIAITLFSVNQTFTQCFIFINKNIDVYKPYTYLANEYMKQNEVKSCTSTLNFNTVIYSNRYFNFYTGISYKKIDHKIKSKILSFDNQIGVNSFQKMNDSIDLISSSHSFGIPLGFYKNNYNKNKFTISSGLQIDVHLVEYFKSVYKSNKGVYSFDPLFPIADNFFILPATQLTIFSTYKYAYNDHSSIGIRLQAGTNLYSNWDQFKRYAWLGVGLEWEIGRRIKN